MTLILSCDPNVNPGDHRLLISDPSFHQSLNVWIRITSLRLSLRSASQPVPVCYGSSVMIRLFPVHLSRFVCPGPSVLVCSESDPSLLTRLSRSVLVHLSRPSVLVRLS